MIGVDEARERILATISPCGAVAVPLLEALGLVLAEDVVAQEDIPPFRNSAMDGYAVRASDTREACDARPVRLAVVADIAAGHPSTRRIDRGQAARITTGAALPEGADAVIRFEETGEREGGAGQRAIDLSRAVRTGENVRYPGEDVAAGTKVLAGGTLLRPATIGLLASLNRASVTVHRRPRVGVLSTGDELVDVGPALGPGKIRNSNSYTLAALVRQTGGEPVMLGVARDSIDDIRAKLLAAHGVDLLVTSGGVSIGDYDVVKDVLQAEGDIDLWQVRIKPGKPMAFGRIGSVPLLGLPGNPVAAVVAFIQFGRPAMFKLLGRDDWSLPTLRARLLTAHENAGRRRHFVRGVVERGPNGYVVRQAGAQGSGMLTSLARANCLIVLPETWDHAEAGAEVDVQLLDGAWPI